MLHKIGIEKCSRKNIKFFSILSPTKKISTLKNQNTINSIISIMVVCDVIDTEIIDFNDNISNDYNLNAISTINVLLRLNYKMIYHSREDKKLQVINDIDYHITQIKVRSYLEGSSIKQLNHLKKLKISSFVENIDATIVDENNVMINPYLLVDIGYIKSFTLAYIFSQGSSQNNIFISYEDGTKLTQLTFSSSVKYKNLCWSLFSNEVAYLTNEDNYTSINLFNVNSKKNKKIPLHFNFDYISSFCYTSNENMLLCAKSSNSYDLYRLNITTNKIEKIFNASNELNKYKPKFSLKQQKIYFILEEKENQSLCCINLNGLDFKKISQNTKILDYSVSYDEKYVVVLDRYKDDIDKLYLVSLDTNKKRELNIFNKKHIIKKAIFSNKKNELGLIINMDNKDDIYIYDLDDMSIRNLTRNEEGINICDFSFNIGSDTIYYASDERCSYDINSIDLNLYKKSNLISSGCDKVKFSCKHF